MKTYDYLHQGLSDGKGAYHADQQAPLRVGDLVRTLEDLPGQPAGTVATVTDLGWPPELLEKVVLVGKYWYLRDDLQGPLDPETA